MRLTDEQLRDVYARAEEIERAAEAERDAETRRTGRPGAVWNAELAAVIGAGEEVGLSRPAIERALAERLDIVVGTPVVGSMAWARSADGRYYLADVVAASDAEVRVRFLQGSEVVLTPAEVRPAAIAPGQRVVCEWPNWGKWTCTVVAYDAGRQRIKLSDGWGSTTELPVSEVWLAPSRTDSAAARRRTYALLLGAGAAAGGVIGSIITALLLR